MKISTTISISVLLIGASHASADSILLKSSVRLSGTSEVITLGDIAELNGKCAMEFAKLPIAQAHSAGHVMEISVHDVRDRLNEAGVHWGHVNLSGRSVVVRAARSADAAPPQAMTPAAVDEHAVAVARVSKREEFVASEVIAEPTIRGTIANLIASNLRVAATDLRLSVQRADREVLECSVQSARIEVQPITSMSSDRIDLAIRTWVGEQVQSTAYVSVIPQLRVRAAVLRNDIAKNQMITDDAMIPSEQWLSPSQASLMIEPISAIGKLAAKSMKAGETLRQSNLRRDALIKRGDLVIVRCLVGGVAISLQAEARGDGAEGERIEFRKTGERDTFLATVNARGEAVINLSQQSSKMR